MPNKLVDTTTQQHDAVKAARQAITAAGFTPSRVCWYDSDRVAVVSSIEHHGCGIDRVPAKTYVIEKRAQ